MPAKYEKEDKWRDYLFDNTINGYVIDDILVKKLIKRNPDAFLEINEFVSDDSNIVSDIGIGECGKYSFLPDKHNCDNCVTWATRKYNKYATNLLPHFKNGSIREACDFFGKKD